MKHYFVLGASSGIGKATADLLINKGHRVYATYNNTDVQSNNELLTYHQLDVMDDQYNLSFLPEQLDGFVYCPGNINLAPFKRFHPKDFIEDFQLQVNGAVSILHEILNKLKKSVSASVVFYSTVAVQQGYNFHSLVATSKGAIEGLTRALAAEFAPKIRVNAIAPSLTDTRLAEKLLNSEEKIQANADRHPLKRIGTVDDIAKMTGFLLSEDSSWITGQILHVDGGMSSIK